MKKLIGLLVVFAVATTMSYAATVSSNAGEAKAKIIQAPTLAHVNNAALDFGVIVKSGSAGTVTLEAVASPTAAFTGGLTAADGGVSSDHFTLTGLDAGTTYSIGVPANFTISDGDSHTMTVTPSVSPSSVSSTAADQDIYVGGVLSVAADQAVGAYQGNYTVTVTY